MTKIDKRKEAVLLLAKNISQTRVAQMVGVDRRTILRWMKDDAFCKELSENRRDHLETVLDKVIENSGSSVLSMLN
jgi:transcriptional regulator with XRE-family HTH domain